jgi:hypothetical protein
MNIFRLAALTAVFCGLAYCATAHGAEADPIRQAPGQNGPTDVTEQQAKVCAAQGGCAYVSRQWVMELIRQAQERAFEAGYEKGRARNGAAT